MVEKLNICIYVYIMWNQEGFKSIKPFHIGRIFAVFSVL